MVFGLFGSVAKDLMFLSVQVQLLIPATVQLPVSLLSVYFNGVEAAVSVPTSSIAYLYTVLGLCTCIF